jgi:regulator of sigma E protease
MITILAFLFVFTLVVFVHEGGHYLAAKYSKMGVLEFSIGFGKSLFSFKRNGTDFKIGWLPLGGMVRIAGLDEDSKKIPKKLNYHFKNPWLKMLTVSAGPLMNFAFAIVLFTLIFSISGIPTGSSAVIDQVFPNTPASSVGLISGDKVVRFQGEPVKNMAAVIEQIHGSAGKTVWLTVERGTQTLQFRLVPQSTPQQKVALIGISLKPGEKQRLNPFAAILAATLYVLNMLWAILLAFVQLITGQMGLNNVMGPIGMAQMTGQAAKHGFETLITFMAIISVNLGFFNLLPIPALDGGRMVFIAYEIVAGKSFHAKAEQWIHAAGFALLLGLIAVVSARELFPLLTGIASHFR